MQRRLLPRTPDAVNGFSWAAMLMPAGRSAAISSTSSIPIPASAMLIADVSERASRGDGLTLLRSTFGTRSRRAEPRGTRLSDVRGGSIRVARVAVRDRRDCPCRFNRADPDVVNAATPRIVIPTIASTRLRSGPAAPSLSRAGMTRVHATERRRRLCVCHGWSAKTFDEHLQPWREGPSMRRGSPCRPKRCAPRSCRARLAGHAPTASTEWRTIGP